METNNLLSMESINAATGGIGLLVSSMVSSSLSNVEIISSIKMMTTFNGNPNTTIISCYSPTNVSEELDLEFEQFYLDLAYLTIQIPIHNMLVMGGDFNAQIDQITYSKFSVE